MSFLAGVFIFFIGGSVGCFFGLLFAASGKNNKEQDLMSENYILKQQNIKLKEQLESVHIDKTI